MKTQDCVETSVLIDNDICSTNSAIYSSVMFQNVFSTGKLRKKMAAAGSFFVTVSCIICRNHVYKEVWSLSIGKIFVCLIADSS